MKRALFVSPHFPPVNAPDHQRIRLALPYLNEHGWEAEILCIDHRYVRKPKDQELVKTTESHPVHAAPLPLHFLFDRLSTTAFGWRSLYAIDKRAESLLKTKTFDVAYFSTTIFSTMLLGPRWRKRHSLPYVIDMHDPWYSTYYTTHPHVIPPGGHFKFGLTNRIAKFLEPQVLTHANGVTSVSQSYLDDFEKRYPWLSMNNCKVIPFGASETDFQIAEQQDVTQLLLKPNTYWCSAGRGGPDLKRAVNILAHALRSIPEQDRPRVIFLGTSYLEGTQAKPSVTPLLDNISDAKLIEEFPERLPYFSALKLLKDSAATIVVGSDDTSYNPSKIANLIMTKRPIIAVLRAECPAARILKRYPGAILVTFDDQRSDDEVARELSALLGSKLKGVGQTCQLDDEVRTEIDSAVQTKRLLDVLSKAIA